MIDASSIVHLPAVHGGPGVPHQQHHPVHRTLGQQGPGAGQWQPQQLEHQRGEDRAEEGQECRVQQ